jgi:hypothetical protein
MRCRGVDASIDGILVTDRISERGLIIQGPERVIVSKLPFAS